VRRSEELFEPSAYLYAGEYFSDTLHLSAAEHRALRLLLLKNWVRGFVPNARLAKVARLFTSEWKGVGPVVLLLLAAVRPPYF
jgi:uncharacterized protein YdaU (DUF1376 family)